MRLNCSVCMDSWRDERNMTRTSHSPVGSAMVKCIAMAVIDMRIIFPVTKTYPVVADMMVHLALRKTCARAMEQDSPYQYSCVWGV